MAEKFAPFIPRPSPTGIRTVNTLTEFCFSISVVRAFAGGALHEFDAASFGVVLEGVAVCHVDHATKKSRHCQRRRPGRVFGVCFAHMEGLISLLFFATLVYGAVIAFQQNGKTSRRSSRRRENHESSMSATRGRGRAMNWNGASADTLSVVIALDEGRLLYAARARYMMMSSFSSRAHRARRACEWVGVDGGEGVDWSMVASLFDEMCGS